LFWGFVALGILFGCVEAWAAGLSGQDQGGPTATNGPSPAPSPAAPLALDSRESAAARAISLANPERAVSAFYQAVSRKDCERAEGLWPGFGEDRCRAATDVNLMANQVVCSEPRIAVVQLELSYIMSKGRARVVEIFQGYLTLDNKETGWTIREGSQRPQESIALEAYTREVARMKTVCADPSKTAEVAPEGRKPGEGPAKPQVPATQQTKLGPMPVTAPAPSPAPSEAQPASQPQAPGQTTASAPSSATTTTPKSAPPFAAPGKPNPASVLPPLPPGAPRPGPGAGPGAGLGAGTSPATAPPPAPPVSLGNFYAPPQDFGSQLVLEACWSAQELHGTEEDKTIRAMPDAGRVQPPRGAPRHMLRPLPAELQNSIRRVEPRGFQKIAALTFDLCERQNELAGYDAAIVNYLRANGVKATFFAGGKWMATHPDKAMQLMADPLFELGNHAWTHGNLRQLKGREMEEQILWTQNQYELLWNRLRSLYAAQRLDLAELDKIPKTIQTFRFPYGVCSAESLRFLTNHGLPAIQWDVVTGDPAKEQTAEGITRAVMSETKPGSIIICHANGRGHGTAKALTQFIPRLREKGYHFVTVSELLTLGKAQSSPECYERKPGDNARYDK
jgi:peptidoglycan/xylan/chitin deacetylase (PgdA/CDA1 family)